MTAERRRAGMTLVELTLAIAILALLVVGLSGVIRTALLSESHGRTKVAAARDAQFAMQRIVAATARAPTVLIPIAEDAKTAVVESLQQPGILALRVDPSLDLDRDGFSDADNDRDGRIDEDWPQDISNDGRAGLYGLDDNHDLLPDTSFGGAADDDERLLGPANEDPINGIDDDGDGSVDEDPAADMNGDGAVGVALVDDDGDGSVDEGSSDDDDEDGGRNEDWVDAVVFRLNGTNLLERRPVLGASSGSHYIERVIAENVTRFRVERLPRGARRYELLDVGLDVGSGDALVSIQTRIRVGSRL